MHSIIEVCSPVVLFSIMSALTLLCSCWVVSSIGGTHLERFFQSFSKALLSINNISWSLFLDPMWGIALSMIGHCPDLKKQSTSWQKPVKTFIGPWPPLLNHFVGMHRLTISSYLMCFNLQKESVPKLSNPILRKLQASFLLITWVFNNCYLLLPISCCFQFRTWQRHRAVCLFADVQNQFTTQSWARSENCFESNRRNRQSAIHSAKSTMVKRSFCADIDSVYPLHISFSI